MTSLQMTNATIFAAVASAVLAAPSGAAVLTTAPALHLQPMQQSLRAQALARVAYLNGLPTVIRPDIAERIARRQFGAGLRQNRSGMNPDVFPWPNYVYTCQTTLTDCTIWSNTPPGVPPYLQGPAFVGLALNKPVGTIVNAPGNWWIANEGASNILYATGANGGAPVPAPLGNLADPGQLPVDVDANLNGSLVAVANIFTTFGGNGSVSVYVNGALNPTRTLIDPEVPALQGVGVMIDKPGNCFFSYNNLMTGKGGIVEFKQCKGKALPVPGLPVIGAAGGMAMDGGVHNLYYVDQVAKAVFKCTGEAGPCAQLSWGYTDPVYINFDGGWNHLWVSDVGMNVANGELCYRSGAAAVQPAAQCYATAALNGDPPVGVAPAAGSLY